MSNANKIQILSSKASGFTIKSALKLKEPERVPTIGRVSRIFERN